MKCNFKEFSKNALLKRSKELLQGFYQQYADNKAQKYYPESLQGRLQSIVHQIFILFTGFLHFSSLSGFIALPGQQT